MSMVPASQQDARESMPTRALAAEALLGMACILLGGEMLDKSLKALRNRGVSLSSVVPTIALGDSEQSDALTSPTSPSES